MAVSVPQPAAWAVTYAGQRILHRTHPTEHRGSAAIHAGEITRLPSGIVAAWTRGYLPTRAVVALAELAGCEYAGSACRPGCWHWSLGMVWPLARPVACEQRDGLFELPVEVYAAVRDQMQAVAR